MNNEGSYPQIEEFYTIVKELEKFDTFTNFLDVHQPTVNKSYLHVLVDELTSALISKKDIKLKAYMVILHKRNV